MYRIHNQSTILRDSDWTSSRAKEFIWSLKHLEEWVWRTASEELRLKNCIWRTISEERHLKNCIWRTASEELHLKNCIWRTPFEETSLKKSSWRHVIRSKNIRSTDHQKHISPEATSPELTKDSVRSVRPWTLQPPSLQCLSLKQDKDNSYIAAEVVPFVLEWIWIQFFIGQLSNQAKDQGWRIEASNQDKLM